MPREAMPTLTRMIQDQIRPVGQSDAEYARLIEEGERRTRDSYNCLY
jgi:hypothetical protein